MDRRFQNMGFTFSSNYLANAFKILGSSVNVGGAGPEYHTDTILRLDSPGFLVPDVPSSKGIKRKRSLMNGPQVDPSLSLVLGRSSSSSDSKGSSVTGCTSMSSAKETDEESSMSLDLDFTLHLRSEKIPSPKESASPNFKGLELPPKLDLQLSLSTGISESDITTVHPGSCHRLFGLENLATADVAPNTDEGSKAYCWNSSFSLPPLQTPLNEKANICFNQAQSYNDLTPIVQDLSSSLITTPKSSVTCISETTRLLQQQQNRTSNSKTCQIEGCGKGARGASGRCISHGGGRRCQKQGCQKGAEGRTVYCKAHGGGRRCEFLGCTKSAEGRTDFCIAHGGGRRCSKDGCTRAARGKSGLCIRHGGGKRCQHENCTKSAEGLSGLCISHGGGRRCQAQNCCKGAQGSTMFCKAHGGGKRCTFIGCRKGAEGSTPFCKGHGGGKPCTFQGGGVCSKSVHGGTNFCVAHGGGKRCAVPKCTKSARGRTDYCVRHGGGKRCKSEGCGKSAQGSTDFCKAHGGGKKCSWGHPGSEFGPQPSGPCGSYARGKTGLCVLHSSLVHDKRVHGGALEPMVHDSKLNKPEKMKGMLLTEDMNVDMMETGSGTETSTYSDLNQYGVKNSDVTVGDMSAFVPEGRVHGGSFMMAMLANGSSLGMSSSKGLAGDAPQSWF